MAESKIAVALRKLKPRDAMAEPMPEDFNRPSISFTEEDIPALTSLDPGQKVRILIEGRITHVDAFEDAPKRYQITIDRAGKVK